MSDLPPDRRLLVAAAQGDRDASGEFSRRHARSPVAFFLHRTASAEVAADLAHEPWVAVLQRVSSDRGDGPPAARLYGPRTLRPEAERGGPEA